MNHRARKLLNSAGTPPMPSLLRSVTRPPQIERHSQLDIYCREYLVNAPPACVNEFGPSAA